LGPSERWLKKFKNLFCKYVLKFNFAPITGSDFFYFLFKTQNSWTLLERHSGTLYMFSSPLSPFTHMYSEEPSLPRLKCTEVETGQRRQAPLLDVLSLTSFIHGFTAACAAPRPMYDVCTQQPCCPQTWLFFSSLCCPRYTYKMSGFKTSDFKTSGFKMSETSGFKTSETSGLQNFRFAKRQVYKMSGLQNVRSQKSIHIYFVLVVGGNPLVLLQPCLQAK
jgi:hypothetical protein